MFQVRSQIDQAGIQRHLVPSLQCHLGVQAGPVWKQNDDCRRSGPGFHGRGSGCRCRSARNDRVCRTFYRDYCGDRQSDKFQREPAAASPANAPAALLLRACERLTSRPLSHTTGIPSSRCLRAALARGSREPGQALTGAAISGVLLCEGHSQAAVFLRIERFTAHLSVDDYGHSYP